MQTITFKLEPQLGEGLFTIMDAATILNLPASLIRRWIKVYWENYFLNDAMIIESNYVWGRQRDKAFNFYVLIEIIAVYSLRKVGVSFTKIKLAHTQLMKILKIQYPFASSQLMSDGGEIFWDYSEDNLIKLDHSLQLSFKKIIEPFCKKLDFNETTLLAQKYWPLGKQHSIVIDPHHCFGQPTISGTNINVKSILKIIKAGEDKRSVAIMYNISEKEIDDILLFDRRLAA